MSQTFKNEVEVPLKHSIKVAFDDSGGVSNYGEKTRIIVEHFKSKTAETLAKNGIAIEWISLSDQSYDCVLKLVEIDTGNKTIRSIIGFLPVFSHFCGPAARFEVEGYWKSNSKNAQLHYIEKYHNATFGTEWAMRICSGKVAIRFADEINRFIIER